MRWLVQVLASGRERRRRQREEAEGREREIGREAQKHKGEASDLSEKQWIDLVLGREDEGR